MFDPFVPNPMMMAGNQAVYLVNREREEQWRTWGNPVNLNYCEPHLFKPFEIKNTYEYKPFNSFEFKPFDPFKPRY